VASRRDACEHPAAMRAAYRTILLAAGTGLLLVIGISTARAADYLDCVKTGDAILVKVSGAPCEDAQAVATALTAVPAPGVETVLRAQGWTPLRAAATGFEQSYELFATRGRAAFWIRRRGEAPDLDGWAAGRELIFSRVPLATGTPPPGTAALCTSGFLIEIRGHLGGLTAAHCAGLTKRKTTLRRNAALRREPQAGIVLGDVQRNLARKRRRLDALVLRVPAGPSRPAAAVIDRGILGAPWFVGGSSRAKLGLRVCFSGRTSGVDLCGKIVRSYPGAGGLPCTTISAAEGDSGSPVYTAPAANGTVRAVGIATLVVGLFEAMCFTPVEPVLDALGARLVTAPAS
jgi:hypothetical protein